MKVKIFNVIKQYVFTSFLFIVLLVISGFLPFRNYSSIAVLYIAFNYYTLLGIIRMGGKDQSKESLYHWLDILDGSGSLIRRMFIHEKNKDIISNLETVYNKLLLLTNHDKRKLKLLKGYFSTLNNEGPFDLFFKTILGILVAIIAWGINKGVILGFTKMNIEDIELLRVTPLYIEVLNYSTIIFLGGMSFAVLIKNYYKEKTRNRVILEIIDVCIEHAEDRKNHR